MLWELMVPLALEFMQSNDRTAEELVLGGTESQSEWNYASSSITRLHPHH